MQIVNAGLALLAVLALCAFFSTHLNISGALTPLLSISIIMLWFSLAGVLGVLFFAGWIFYIAAFALLFYTLLRHGIRKIWTRIQTPGLLFFALLALLALVVLAARQPVLLRWDEFSFWGTAAKLMKLNHSLYTTAPMGWEWTATQRPALVVLGYFTQFFGTKFTPWNLYFGYNLLLFACFAAMLAPFKAKQWRLWVPLGTVCLLVPFFFEVSSRVTSLATPYISSYADLPAGVLFGGVLATYITVRRDKANGGLWVAIVPLAAFALVKANTFPIVLVAAGMMAADTLLFCAPWKNSPLGDANKKNAWMRILGSVTAFFAAPLAAVLVWNCHAEWANALNPVTDGKSTGISELTALRLALGQILGQDAPDGKWAPMAARFVGAFFNRVPQGIGEGGAPLYGSGPFAVSMFGSCAVLVGLIVALLALAVLLAPRGRARRRTLLAAALSTAGFAGYAFVLLLSYAYLFKNNEGITDFSRYISSYGAGWLLLALLLVALNAAHAGARSAQPSQITSDASPNNMRTKDEYLAKTAHRKLQAARLASLLLACAMLLQFARLVPPGQSVLDYDDSVYAPLRREEALAAAVTAQIAPGARTFFVSQGDDGQRWFRYAHFFLPALLDYSKGGATFGPYNPPQENPYFVKMSLKALQAYLNNHNCEYIFIERLDETFIHAYAPLFSNQLQDHPQTPALYKLGTNGQYDLVSSFVSQEAHP